MTKGGLVIPGEDEFTVQPDDETVTSRELRRGRFFRSEIFPLEFCLTSFF